MFAVASVLGVWFALVLVLGAAGILDSPAGSLPARILLAVAAPIILFLLAFRMVHPFRNFVLTLDLRLVTGIQAWRFVGIGFLALYAQGLLPGLFAWPAGLGDIAIAVTTPWVVLALSRRPDFAASKRFMAWNVLGLLDFAVAVGTGVLGSGIAVAIAGEVTTDPMGRLPLVLIPGYLVPLLTMLHVAAMLQGRRMAASGQAEEGRSEAHRPTGAAVAG
jgi:hypothetical protein